MKTIVELNENEFAAAVLESSVPVVVDFYASWCGPCKMLAPLLEQLAVEFEGRLKFTKVDVDQAFNLAARYGISGVPTLIVFRQGQPADTLVGMAPPKALRAWLEKHATAGAPASPARAL